MIQTSTIRPRRLLAEVVERIDLSPAFPGHFQIVIEAPYAAEHAHPGQFIHVLPRSAELMLRRPFSIMAVNRAKGFLTVLFRVIGEGTSILSKAEPGDSLDIIGPLGNGFPIDREESAVVVGGGVGIPPLVFLAERLRAEGLSPNQHDKRSFRVFLGARDLSTLVCLDEFRALGVHPVVATEDGSAGVPGLVSDALKVGHSFNPKTVVYACGPIPMLAAVAKWAANDGFRCLMSLENKLGCGIGACLGCSIPIRESDGNVHYERVCVDGPVFDADRVAFDLM